MRLWNSNEKPEKRDASRLARSDCFDRGVGLGVIAALGAGTTGTASRPATAGLYTPSELVNAGHRFFDTVSGAFASVIEHAVSQWGLPNGYVLGEEAGGAFFGGLRYGEGMLYTKNAGDLKVFWQGPSVGWDFGGEGAPDHDAGL